jgi:hypothetical protein
MSEGYERVVLLDAEIMTSDPQTLYLTTFQGAIQELNACCMVGSTSGHSREFLSPPARFQNDLRAEVTIASE